MFSWAMKKLFGTSHERAIRRLQPKVAAINDLEPRVQKLTDQELKAKTAEFREKLENGATLDDLMVTIHPHPTLSEALMEAAEVAAGEAIHINPPRKVR